MGKITTFDDWTDYFRQWQRDIGLDPSKFGDYKFEVKFGPPPSDVIEFGDFAAMMKFACSHTRKMASSMHPPNRRRCACRVDQGNRLYRIHSDGR